MSALRRLAYIGFVRSALRSELLAPITTRARGWVRKRRSKTLRRRKDAALKAHGPVLAGEILNELRADGIAEGDTVFVQISMTDMLTFSDTAPKLLASLRALTGDAGTLLMPAYTLPGDDVFDRSGSATYTGIVNEIFRRTPGVIRSLHPRHSICGIGTHAHAILDGHDTCLPADGPGSPFDRLRALDRAWIVTLGLPAAYVSFLHWVEDVDPKKFPVPIHQSTAAERRVRYGADDVRVVRDFELRPAVLARLDLPRIARHLSPAAMRHRQYKAIDIGVYSVKTLADELLALRDAGIVHYR